MQLCMLSFMKLKARNETPPPAPIKKNVRVISCPRSSCPSSSLSAHYGNAQPPKCKMRHTPDLVVGLKTDCWLSLRADRKLVLNSASTGPYQGLIFFPVAESMRSPSTGRKFRLGPEPSCAPRAIGKHAASHEEKNDEEEDCKCLGLLSASNGLRCICTSGRAGSKACSQTSQSHKSEPRA